MSKENQLTPEEITSVISEQPDLYEPTVQPLDAIQQNGYYPIELDEDNNQVITPSLAKLATPKSDRNWMERLKVSAKNAVSNIMNEQLTHNVAMGNALVTISKDKDQIEYGRLMASEAKRHLDEIMDDTEQLTPEEAESWAAAIGSGSVSMVDFAANLALLRGLGAGKVGAEIGAGILAGIAGYEEGATSDVEKYIAETGDTELKNYKGDKKALAVNAASGAVQGGIEALTSGLGRYILNNPLSKKVLGTAGQNAIRKVMGSAVGRALAAGANESVNNAFEEWTQQLTGNLAEIVKGNKEFTVDNILQGAGQAAGVGALLGWMATPVMQEYGRRKTRDWVSDKLRKAADEKGIEISDAEIKKAANDLVGIIESKGVQQVTDNYEKINQITGAESDLAKTLSKAFEDLVNAGRVRFRGATEDEVRQAGLDWANWMQAQAILDSLDRGIALSEHPLNNAVAELDRIYLEGMNAGEGDLLTLDINNAQVQYLAEQIDDFIQKSQQSREQAEAARIEALREAELNARLEAVKELEQNAIAELEKARLEQNEEAIANLTLDLNMLTARVDSLTSELQGLITNRQQNTGRISIKQAKGLESPRKTPKKNAFKEAWKNHEPFGNGGTVVKFDDKYKTKIFITPQAKGKNAGKFIVSAQDNNGRYDTLTTEGTWGNLGQVDENGVAIPWSAQGFDTLEDAYNAIAKIYEDQDGGDGGDMAGGGVLVKKEVSPLAMLGYRWSGVRLTKDGETGHYAFRNEKAARDFVEEAKKHGYKDEDIEVVGFDETDDRLDYQKGFVSLKGEMEGDYIDANKHGGEGEGGSAWAWGNYFLASRRLDEENYYKKFSRWGPDLRYDGQLVDSADFFNKLGIYDDNTREVIAHATNIMDTKERVVANLEDKLAQNKEKFDKHIENVVKQFKGALGEKRVKEIIDDIIKIVSGKGFAVGPLATFNEELQPEEYKIQQKYRDDSGRLSDDVVDIYKALMDEFGGNHWFDSDYFTHDLLNLRQQEKSLEAVKKLDWDKFTGKTGMTYKGQDVVGALGSAVAKTVGNTGTYEANTMIPRILELFRDSLSKNKEIKTELANLEKPIKEIADTAPTAKKEIKEKLKEILADKTLQTRRFYEGADVKEVEKELLAFVDGTNTADYYSFADLREKNNWDISSPEAMLADAVLWSRFNKKNYPENITKEADTNLIDLAYAIREANTKLAILKAAQKEFVSNKDFVYKPTASMYRSDAIPENKFLLDMGKSLEEQPSYVKDAIIKLYTETGVGIEPITWENIRLINPALPRIYNAKEILPDPKSEDFKSDKMRTINLYDGAADRFVIRWRNRGLASAVEDVANWVKGLEQQRDEFKNHMNRSDFPQNTREANERAYLEAADMAEVLKFLYDKVSKIPKDAKIEDYVLVEPKILDNTTGKSYYRQLEESLGKESNKAVFDSLNAKTAHEAASKLLLRYGIRGVRYWGRDDHRGFVTFEPTPVNEKLLQETLNNDTLMAVHSMSLEGAMKALDLGGMAMPSMAITKVQDGVRGLYGDVVLLGDVRLAAPSRTTDVYDRDAWTPVVNSIIYEFDSDMYKKIQDLLEAKGQNKNAASSYTHNIAASMTDGSDPRNNTMAVELFAIYKGIDQDTAREQIKYNWDKPFTPLHEEYIQWYNDFLLKNAKAYIHMGWTPSGAVRKKPLNIENLVAEMKTQDRYARMGGDYFTPGDVLKFNLVRFKNLQEVRDAQGRIVPTEEAVEATREMGSRFFALASELKPDDVEGYDATDQRLAYALIYGKGSMKERLEGNGLKSDPESVKKVEQFVKDIKSMPVKYFEVKPRRAVRFDEFSGAILPTSEEYDVLEERLRDNGMRFVYRADTQEQKNAALQDLYKQNPFVLFQNKKTSASKTGLGKEYRGAYDPLTRAILFSKVSDVTTLFHESAHYWFDRNLRYYKTGMASPEWKDRWEKVMEELGVVPNARGYVTAASVKAGSEKFARSMEAYLKTGEYENAAMQWAHQDYKNMVGRVYRNLWKNYWGLEDLSPAVKDWFNMNGFDVSNPMTAFAEKTTMDTAEEDIGNIVATDETKPDVPAVVQEEADAANGQVVENRKGEVAIVPEDEYETDKRVHSKLPESAERATGVEMEPIMFNRRSMSDSLRAARDLVDRDPVRAWEALKAGDDMIDGLYAGDIYRALISKYKEENNPTMIKTVVQSFANAARRAGRSVKAFDLETPTVSYEGTISSLNKVFATKSNDAKVNELVKQIKNFLHEPEALNKGWEKFKEELECK